MDDHETLGVGKDASKEEIKAAYLRKATECHPDAGGDAAAFKRIGVAYDNLSGNGSRCSGSDDLDSAEAKRKRAVTERVSTLFREAFAHGDEPVKRVKNHLKKTIADLKRSKDSAIGESKSLTKKLEKFLKANEKVTNRESVDLIEMSVRKSIAGYEQVARDADEGVSLFEDVDKFIEELLDPERPPQTYAEMMHRGTGYQDVMYGSGSGMGSWASE